MSYKSKFLGTEMDEAFNYVLGKLKTLFETTSSDNGKFLIVENGVPSWKNIEEAEEVET